ncbi:MAG: hypothetical protein D6814_12340 [Calditrichaeota bacterium]|nr:MAG: hypothetical protein D6814_12340 [Calditrichota bacterium]
MLPPELVIVSKDSLPGISDWREYLLQRQANNWQWPPVGGWDMEVQLDQMSHFRDTRRFRLW